MFTTSISQLIGTAATAYGVIAAVAVLLQARQMLARRASCEVSGRFFSSYVGGYGIWLLYGLSVGSTPLIVVDAVGLLCGGFTLGVALSVRGSLLRPRTWTSCNQIQVSKEGSDLVPPMRGTRSGPTRTPFTEHDGRLIRQSKCLLEAQWHDAVVTS